MRAYAATTGIVFGLLVVAHVWRVAEEGTYLAREPFFVLATLGAAILCGWAGRLLRTSRRV